MPNAHREVPVKMKPTAVKWCIIEIKGHEDIRVPLFTLTAVTDTEGEAARPRDHDIKPSSVMFLSL